MELTWPTVLKSLVAILCLLFVRAHLASSGCLGPEEIVALAIAIYILFVAGLPLLYTLWGLLLKASQLFFRHYYSVGFSTFVGHMLYCFLS